jgi:phosphatidylglycerophosphate synthase
LHRPDLSASRPSLRELYAQIVGAYNAKKRGMDAQFVLYRALYRPLSFPLTVLFIRAGFSANQVSLLNALLLLVVLAFLASGINGLMLAGAALFFVFYVLDFVDGNIARYRNQASYFGKLLDGSIDTVAFLIFGAVALGNARAGHALLGPGWELSLGVLTMVAALLNQNTTLRLGFLRMESQLTAGAAPQSASAPAEPRQGPMRLANWLYQNAQVSTPIVLLVAALTGTLTLFTCFFAAVHAGVGSAASLASLLRARRMFNLPRSH